jgi:general nucleoside transport system permease protein
MASITVIVALLAATLRMATPLIFAGLGGVFSEKSGVVNIGLEGMMTIGAFFAVLGTYITGSPVLGILIGMLAGCALGLIHAFLSITLRADQIISGTAINLFSTAFASFMIYKVFKKGGQTDLVKSLPYDIPKFIKGIPVIGDLLSQLNWFVIFALILVFVVSFILYRTSAGLRIRSVGEHPAAADTLGINVYKIRYICVALSGALAGLGGAALSLGIAPLYREGMVSGRGFIALAALIFGNWTPKGTMWACLLFGFADAFQMKAQGFGWSLPQEIYAMFPYVLTMLALAGFIGKTQAPAADGTPYIKGER